MELKKLSEFFKSDNYKFLKLDYLYFHHKEGYPLKKEMDFENFYFVIDVYDGDKIKVVGLLSGKEKEINFSDLKDNWWFLRIPERIKKNIFK